MSLRTLYLQPVPVDFLRDESRKTGSAEAISFPRSIREVADAARDASAGRKAVTVQGSRTGISAGAVPDGGVIISLSKMDAILGPVAGENAALNLRVQPGVTLASVRRYLAATPALAAPATDGARPPASLFFAPDPTETSASLGGMAACNSSGACSFAYGATRNHIQALTVVLADGDILNVRRGREKADGLRFAVTTAGGRGLAGALPPLRMPAVKSAAGYWIAPGMDLLDLFIGSEGTLGIVAELELRLTPKPAETLGLVCYFEHESQALNVVQSLRRQAPSLKPHTLAAIEYFDAGSLRLIRGSTALTGLVLPPPKTHWKVALYLEWALAYPDPAPALLTARLLGASGGHADDTWMASDAPSLDKMKAFRHAVPEQVNALIAERKRSYPELTKLGTDLSVPDDKLSAVMEMYRHDLSAARLEHVIFGHIGNNHVHVNILPRDMAEFAAGKSLYRKWAEQVVAWGGSVSAEHGVGRLKKELLAIMYGAEQIDGMRRLKALFDPDMRLNPNRLFDLR